MKYNFSIDKFELVQENSNSQFATIECDVCRSGNNSHRLMISRDAIKDSANSIKAKPILASFNITDTDFQGHDSDEVPIGFFEDIDPELVEKDDELYIRAKGRIWKRYFSNAMDIFANKENRTDVSMECEMLEGKDPTMFEDGSMDLFSITGVTLLGVKPSIQGSECRVLSFSELQNEYNKEQDTLYELQEFVAKRKENFVAKSYKINKTELKDTPWGDVDKVAMRNKIMDAKNKNTLVKSVYMLVENGWQDAPSEHLKYPVMQLVDDTFYYNRYGLAAALAYAKQENEESVINKIEKLYDKFELNDKEGESKNMSEEIKEFAVDIGDMWGKVYHALDDGRHYGYGIEGLYEEDNKKFVILRNYDEDKLYRVDFDFTEEGLFLHDEKVEVEKVFIEKGEALKFECPNEIYLQKFEEKYPEDDAHSTDEKIDEEVEEDDEDNEKGMCDDGECEECEEKKMSLDVHADIAAYLAMLENETEEYRELGRKVLEQEDKGIVMQEYISMAKELNELREFKMSVINEKRDFEVNKILAEVKADVTTEQFEALSNEGAEINFDNITMFANKARAIAYSNSKKQNEEKDDIETTSFARMGFAFNNDEINPTNDATSIYGRY